MEEQPPHVDLYKTVDTEGEGNFCIQNAWVGEEVAERREDGTGRYEKPEWLSLMGEMEEGTFYQCAFVVMQSEIPLLWPTICRNDSSASVRYKNNGGTDGGSDDGVNTSSVTVPTDTGATSGPAMPTRTSTDPAPGVSGAPIDTTSATSSASNDTSTASTTSSPAVVVTGAAVVDRANSPFSIAGLAMLIGGAVMV